MTMQNNDCKEGGFSKALALALKRLSLRSYHSQEIRLFLRKKGVPEENTEQVVRYLKDSGYVDDEAFCMRFCQGLQTKGKSAREILLKAKSKGVASSQILPFLQDNTNALEMLIRKKYACLLDKSASFVTKQKAYAALLRRGFLSQEVQNTVNNLIN